MDVLPDEIARIVEEYCGAKEIGVLGRAGRRWRPDAKTWERFARRDPLTRYAFLGGGWDTLPSPPPVLPCSRAKWCEALCGLRVRQPDVESRTSPKFVLQIWRATDWSIREPFGTLETRWTLLSTAPLELWIQVSHSASTWHESSIRAGTSHLHVGDITNPHECDDCEAMRTGAVPESMGISLGLDAEALRFRIVALPRIEQDPFAPTIVWEMEISEQRHKEFVQSCQGSVFSIKNSIQLRGPEQSSPEGLGHHHEDLVFYPIHAASLDNSTRTNALSRLPSLVVRIVRDAAGAAADLVLEELNWQDLASRIGELEVVRLPE